MEFKNGIYCNGENCTYFHCAECSSLMRCIDRNAYDVRERLGLEDDFVEPKEEL